MLLTPMKLIATEGARYKNVRKTNGWWIGYLNNCIENGEDFNSTNNYQGLLESVSVNSVKEAAQKYLNGNNCLRFVLLPVE